MCRHRSMLIPAVLLLFSITTWVSSPVSANTHTWSGPASPCGSTLQGCINGASPGDIVEVATNVPINEDLTIDKSLTLTAALGFTPILADLHSVLLSNPATLANSIRFEHFIMARGFVSAVQASSETFDVGIQYLTIHNTFNGLPGIEVRTSSTPGTYGHMQVGIVGNRVIIPPNSQTLGAKAIYLDGGYAQSLLGLVQQNLIEHYDGGQDEAILIFTPAATLDVTVVANEIRGSDYNDGILFYQAGNVSSTVRYVDNLVVGQTSKSGAPASYGILADAGTVGFEIVNNSAADGDNGILVTGRDDLGASWNGVVANNIVSGMTGSGIVIGQPDLTTGIVENDHNLVFDVGSNLFTPGPGTLFTDPLFMGGGNYRLTDPSPARNAGNNDRVPSWLTTDLDGDPRLVGSVVDMGAYESSSLVATEQLSYERVRLYPNIPNPFNSSTAIQYDLSWPERVWLGVFDARGRLVRWLVSGALQESGPQEAHWDGQDARDQPMPPGVYFYRLEAGQFLVTRRMVLLGDR